MADLRTAFDSPEHKQRYVRTLFGTIADRYDLITIVLSFGRDRAWKRRMADEARLSREDAVIDLACGTGDIAFEAARRGAAAVGLDVTPRMIEIAHAKANRATIDGEWPIPAFAVGDMMRLPFQSASADVVTTGYGLRNVPRLAEALDEIARVLRPGGRLLSLDFNRPESAPVRTVFLWYLTAIGGALGWLLHRDPDTYRYIPESIKRYPGAEGVAALLGRHGFDEVRIVPLFFGLMTLHVAQKGRSADRQVGR